MKAITSRGLVFMENVFLGKALVERWLAVLLQRTAFAPWDRSIVLGQT